MGMMPTNFNFDTNLNRRFLDDTMEIGKSFNNIKIIFLIATFGILSFVCKDR